MLSILGTSCLPATSPTVVTTSCAQTSTGFVQEPSGRAPVLPRYCSPLVPGSVMLAHATAKESSSAPFHSPPTHTRARVSAHTWPEGTWNRPIHTTPLFALGTKSENTALRLISLKISQGWYQGTGLVANLTTHPSVDFPPSFIPFPLVHNPSLSPPRPPMPVVTSQVHSLYPCHCLRLCFQEKPD